MATRKKQFIIYGFRFEENELSETQIKDFYDIFGHQEVKSGSIVFVDSGVVGSHYWLGYLLSYGGDYCDLGITLDDNLNNESIHAMNTFLKDNKLENLKEINHLYFHIITRWA